jgi:tRNA(His) 5'-end guanylyltransferase
MKTYENAFSNKFPIKHPLILRLDGVHFHTNVKRWNCKKPFDPELIDAMQFTAKVLCESISGAKIAYVQSDEITILIRDDMDFGTMPWYDKKINKIMSVVAAKASNAFNYCYHQMRGDAWENEDGEMVYEGKTITLPDMAEFDCRGYILPENEINNAFLWRQNDCISNSVQMLGRAHFSHKELQRKSNDDIKSMLIKNRDTDWDELATECQRGACIIRKQFPKKIPSRDDKGLIMHGLFDTIMVPAWTIDTEIPIFTEDTEYINQFMHREASV